MSYPRVNLLRKSEQRYQGAVSRRFITISVVITPILLIAVLSGIKLVQYSGVQSDLKANREIWAKLEPKLALFNEENRSLMANRKVLALFKGWRDSQLPMLDIMEDVQDIVPLNVQFGRFVLRGNIVPEVYEKAADMKLDFTFQVEGTATGERAEENVWKFHKDLLATASIHDAFDTVDLSDMRKRRSAGEDNVREFRITGTPEGGKQ